MKTETKKKKTKIKAGEEKMGRKVKSISEFYHKQPPDKKKSSQPPEEKTWVIIPALNEERQIEKILTELKTLGFANILVVDDGSKDKTVEKAENAGAMVAKLPVNCGKGCALKTGIDIAVKSEADIIVTMDADGQHNPADIGKLISAIKSGAAAALGTRSYDTKMPFLNLVANRLANILTLIRYGVSVSDSQCGFRAYRASALAKIKIIANNYDFESQTLGEIKRLGLAYREVPIETIYSVYSKNKSDKQNFFNGFKTLYRIFFN